MNPTELSLFILLLGILAFIAFVVCDDDQWPRV